MANLQVLLKDLAVIRTEVMQYLFQGLNCFIRVTQEMDSI